MKTVKATIWDPAEYLESDVEIIAYLSDVFATNDSKLIIAAIGDVARAQGMSRIAGDVECGRESLYKSLSLSGNPSFETVIKVLTALGYSLRLSHVANA
jgi:probable addiction module antidote protein